MGEHSSPDGQPRSVLLHAVRQPNPLARKEHVSTFTLTIHTDNDSFQSVEIELARILHRIADRLDRGEQQAKILDGNGNTVGWMQSDAE